jgi:C4-dicarboxylate transporter DctM subunit
MIERGYDKVYATGLIAVAGGLGVIVPPSIPMVIYGVATSTSIGSLFLAGFFPAIVVALSLGIVNYFISKKRGYKGTGEKFNLKGFLSACWEAKWALLMPVIILGGIYGGVFTPTEAAVISVAYGIVIGLFVYKELKFIDLYRIVDNNTSFVGGVMMTFAPAAALGSIFAMLQVPAAVSSALMTISTNKNIILLIINIFLVFVGMIVDTTSANIILSPLLLAILKPMGVDPIHLGIIMTLNLCIGFVTPPVAVNLFVASGMTKISVERIAKVAIPFIVALFAALMLVTYIPDISLGLLKIMKY